MYTTPRVSGTAASPRGLHRVHERRTGSRHWSGRFRFISTRAAIGRPRGYRLFAFCPRNDVLRVSAYMQPSDRAWQIGFAGVCMCIVHHSRTDHAHTTSAHTYAKLEDTSRGVWSYLHRKWVSATQLSLESRIYIYISFSSHPRRIVRRGKSNRLIEIPRFREKIIIGEPRPYNDRQRRRRRRRC